MTSEGFQIFASQDRFCGRPYYEVEDHAFNYRIEASKKSKLIGFRGTTSYLIATLQLEVAIESESCLFVWGYCPMTHWQLSQLKKPLTVIGKLNVIRETHLKPGVSISLDNIESPKFWFDSESGWFCAGNKEIPPNYEAVEFANRTIAVLVNNELHSLWVKPENWEILGKRFNTNAS